MRISRKQFIKTSALIGGGLLLQSNKLLSAVSSGDERFKTIRNNFGVFTEKGGTIGYYIDDNALVVIDTQFPDTAQHLMEGIRKQTSRSIDILFNTHHHGDHTSGNPYLKQFAKDIVAHENVPALQRKRNMKPGEEDKIVVANVTFKDSFTADAGKEKIKAFHLQPAHTGGDSVIHFENANIAHLGDLVFNRVFPWFSLDDEGSFVSWVEYLKKLESGFDNDTLFIFGHGQGMDLAHVTGKKADIAVMREYLETILTFTEKQIKAGKSEEEVASIKEIPQVKDRKANWDNALGINLREAYKELKRK
ncbi:MAG: MBL fold metallo-hydrolase [Melioribacteraceae bacterium]|nr:MBL fold metallo-hydrolase [Melioribacteraceae bacterium]